MNRNAEQTGAAARESSETGFTVSEVRTGKVSFGKGRDLWRRIVRSRHTVSYTHLLAHETL